MMSAAIIAAALSGGAPPPPGVFAKWDDVTAGRMSANVTTTDAGDRSVQHTAGDGRGSAFADLPILTGQKKYFELQIVALSAGIITFGVGNAAHSLTQTVGGDTDSRGIGTDGFRQDNGGDIGTTFVAGDYVWFEVDYGTGVAFGKNTGSALAQSPMGWSAMGAGGVFPIVCFENGATGVVKINAGQDAWQRTPTSGFTGISA